MNDAYYLNPANDPVGTSADGRGQGGICLPVCRRTLTQDLSGDFSLPDYQPEIKRLLRLTASVTPPEQYVSADTLDLEGHMDYFVLYMGNDNQLYCAPLSTDYHMTLPLSEAADQDPALKANAAALSGHELVCTCQITAEPLTGRVTAPRRLNIKCHLSAEVKAYGQGDLSADPGGELKPASIETLTGGISSGRFFRVLGEPLALQDDMILTPVEGQELRVVCAEGQVMISEAVAGQDMVTCRGDVLLKLTLCPANGNDTTPSVTIRRIPFSQALSLPGVTTECNCCATGHCQGMSVEAEEGHLHTELDLQLEVLAQRNDTTTYEKDQYSTRRETRCEYEAYLLENALGTINGNFTLSDSLPLSEANISPEARVVDVSAVVFPRELTADSEKNRYLLSGTCRVTLILFKDEEYTSTELELPFRYEKEAYGEKLSEGLQPSYQGSVKAITCRARMDGERIGIDAELAVALRLTEDQSVTALRSVTYGEEVTRKRGEYVVCFPSAEDTLWSVAKRYHSPLAALSAANGLAAPSTADKADSLEGVTYLIV